MNDVGKDGSFLGGDAVLGEEDEEFGEGGLHVHSGGEFGEIAEECGSEIDGVEIVRAKRGVGMAEGGGEGSEGQAAAVTVGVAKGTAGRAGIALLAFGGAGFSRSERDGWGARDFLVKGGASGLEFHFGPRFLDGK